MSWSNSKDYELTLRTSEADQLKVTLLEMLQLVNDWLKFAEAKNGGMIGVATAAIAVLLNYIAAGSIGDGNSTRLMVDILFLLGGGCLVLSVLVGISSFLPQTDLLRIKYRNRGRLASSDNLYYFGHLAKYSARELADVVAHHYVADKYSSVEEVHLALAEQVVVNARITVLKLRMFRTAGVLLGTGVLASAGGVIVEYR